jgi:hypothetical protein
MKIDSLKLQVEFDFDNLICTVTDTERNISDAYKHYNAFDDYSKTIEEVTDFNAFIGNCVHAFLDDNGYDAYDMDCYYCELWEQSAEDGTCIHYVNKDCPYGYCDEYHGIK